MAASFGGSSLRKGRKRGMVGSGSRGRTPRAYHSSPRVTRLRRRRFASRGSSAGRILVHAVEPGGTVPAEVELGEVRGFRVLRDVALEPLPPGLVTGTLDGTFGFSQLALERVHVDSATACRTGDSGHHPHFTRRGPTSAAVLVENL